MKSGILIIDDENIIREGLKKLFLLDGYEVFLVENGTQGLESLEINHLNIRVIILDVKMPGLDGMEVLKQIKNKFPKKDVIIITGHGAVETAIEALRYGAFDYINKPIQYEELSLAVQRALDKQKNIEKREQAEKSLRLSEEKYRTLVERASDGIAIIQNEKFKYVNPRLAETLGYGADKMTDTKVVDYICLDNIELFKDYQENKAAVLEKPVLKFLQKNSGVVYIELNSGTINYNDLPAYLVIFRDITERKKAEEKIKYLSFHDRLTGLYNRAYFEEEINRLETERQLPLSIILGDVNGLKLANDAFGHSVGDNLLKAVSECIKKSCRKEDIISRWGGDEFVILLPKVSAEKAQGVCDRIKKSCAEYDKLPISISIALGQSTKSEMSQSAHEVLKEAENNMYRNKLMSRDSVRNAIISSLKHTLHEKSFETEEHSERMENLCISLGKLIGLSSSKIDQLILIATLHDIGKVAISNEILNKPDKLSVDEMEEVKRHPEIGYRIAQFCPEIAHIAEGILSHHERWDGKGYPRGLNGEEIPLEARIVAIVDAYDAMTNKRPYSNVLSKERAIVELKKNAGTQFDPNLVKVFIEGVLEKLRKLQAI